VKSSQNNIGMLKVEDPLTLFRQKISERVNEGMRCRLQYGGITGDLYVEIDIFDPKEHPIKEFEMDDNHPPYIPSTPSASISNIIEEAQKTATNISKVDFEKISAQLAYFLENANEIIADQDVRNTLSEMRALTANLNAISANLNDVLTKKEIESTVQNLNEMLRVTKDLASYLERNPNAIIRGKRDKPVVPSED
ncbi:MAG TPA: hypothetical protein PK821_05215, partial [Victivallales bacterium]|nr:hypothetical protein [Victivallales bacterium]